ncbi:MAG: adenylate/guanylate cyclase domain-containing protein [Mesorhizobium sp.]|nr:adenylate/guanylate cyclase domain-containing protein [Mesorhizobium sp.]MBL8577173.1 adenylate/guanylate cyclase domain-containing protein [Mesorhizobium sp.]
MTDQQIARDVVRPGAFPMRQQTMHPVTLRFADRTLERHYHDARLRSRYVAGRISALAGAIAWAAFIVLGLLLDEQPAQIIELTTRVAFVWMLGMFGLHFLLKPGRWVETVGVLILLVNFCVLLFLTAYTTPEIAEHFTPATVFTMTAVMAFALVGVTFWEGVRLAAVAIAFYYLAVIYLRPQSAVDIIYQSAWMLTTATFAGLGFYLLDRTQRVAWLRQLDLIAAQEEIRSMLYNMLPPVIADRKLAGESPIADTYAQASLLFADVVGFTPLSSRFSSTEVVTMLNDLYQRFDSIVARHGLEKIKTIGDCYMVAGGLPNPDSDHLKRMTAAALEMQAEAAKVLTPDGKPLSLRMGLHAGPVTAGVIGQAKFAFDVWGDTVNTASRLEASGTANRITVSDEVRTALGDAFAFSGPATIEVKGKGPTRVWTLEPIG